MNYTPGPWGVGYHSTRGKRDGALIIEEKTGWNIANLWASPAGGGPSIAKIDADAALISKAPRMFEALEAIANMEVKESTNHAEFSALCISIAKIAIAEGSSDHETKPE